jgi:hypothetical protein
MNPTPLNAISHPSHLTVGDGSTVSAGITGGHIYILAIINSAGSNTSVVQFLDAGDPDLADLAIPAQCNISFHHPIKCKSFKITGTGNDTTTILWYNGK